jgi:glutathione S-transferase
MASSRDDIPSSPPTPPRVHGDREWVLWGSALSPFALKVEALLRFARVPFRWLPAGGPWQTAQRYGRRRRRLVAGRLPLTWPRKTALDEFPQVPFVFGPDGENLYDSSAIGTWLATPGVAPDERTASLLPDAEPALGFGVRLVDEALDEVGLYLVHHNRWVLSARDNDAGVRLAREMRPVVGPLAPLVARFFPARQVRRLPYLFSVAPPAAAEWNDLPSRLRPPARRGFPPTHALLDQAFGALLAAIEPVLAGRPYLFGERFTLGDASLYGELGMNLADPSAWALIRRQAPATARWVERLAAGDFGAHRPGGTVTLDATLAPLFEWIADVFVPLMQQNHAAWTNHRQRGETLFNEKAFDAGRALYDGVLLGHPFRCVAKTFQVRVWQDLRRAWDALATDDRARLAALMPVGGFTG